MKLYIASPYGFSEAGRVFYRSWLIPLLAKEHQIIDPWSLVDPQLISRTAEMPYGPEKRAAWEVVNAIIGLQNQEGIDRADAVLAILDGTDVDSGTAAEVGYAFAKGKLIIGYRGDFRLARDNDGGTVNLQVEHFIRASGGTIVTSQSNILAALRRPVQAL